MSNQQRQQKEKIVHFSHKHPLTLVKIEDEESKSESNNGSFLRCYGCTEKINSGVQYYRCEEDCPLFCLHYACAHLPKTIKRYHCGSWDLQLKKRPDENCETCLHCAKDWYRFTYACSQCGFGLDMRCATRPDEAKYTFHEHPVCLYVYFPGSDDSLCSVCKVIITPGDNDKEDTGSCITYKCNYCDFIAHPECTIWKGDLKHFDHQHSLALVEEAAHDGTSDDDHSIEQDCNCCAQKISSVPYYTCKHCKMFHLHKLCAHLPMELEHQLHQKCPLKLLTGPSVNCDVCDEKCNGFTYSCSVCKFDLHIQCALRTQKMDKIFHKHPLFLSHSKAPFSCHACDRDTGGSSYQCTSCKFWVHEQCASLPTLKERSSHEHDLELVYTVPEKFSGVVVYCRICTKALKHHRWAYHCNLCRYLTHVHDCSDLHRNRDEVTINECDVVHLPLASEPILEERITNGKMIKHHRHPMILFADQFESNAIDITPYFRNLIRGSATWPTLHADGKDYGGFTFSFHNSILTMQATVVDLPLYIRHEAHPHVLERTFLSSSTWCHACEQSFFGCGFKCTTCAFTIDPYCVLLPRIMKHRYDEHNFSLTYSAIVGVEEYVCEICEEDVIPKYFYHCVACDQSIHARCIWQACVRFEASYRLHRVRQLGFLVPPSEDLPQCIICDQKETFGHGFAFRGVKNNKTFMVHLTCLSEDDVQT